MKPREITGHHVFLIAALAFGVIISVNLTLAVNAVRTFPGLEVKNSYIASQSFDRDRSAQVALGWEVEAAIDGNQIRLSIKDRHGVPVQPASLAVTFGRTTHVADDQRLDLAFDGAGFVGPVVAAPGLWSLRVEAEAKDGTLFRKRLELRSRPDA